MSKEREFIQRESKNKEYTAHISPKLNQRLNEYCGRNKINKLRFIENVLSNALSELEEEELKEMSREQLIQCIKDMRSKY